MKKSLRIDILMSWEWTIIFFNWHIINIWSYSRQKENEDFTKTPFIKPTTKLVLAHS